MFVLNRIIPGSHKIVVFDKPRTGRYSRRHRQDAAKIIYSGYIDIPEAASVYAKLNRYDELVIMRVEDIEGDIPEDENILPELDLLSVTSSMERASFSSDKRIIAEQAISTHAVWAYQIADILRKFSFESDKLKLAKFAYQYCMDKEKYYTINEIFDFSSSIRKLDKYIRNFRP